MSPGPSTELIASGRASLLNSSMPSAFESEAAKTSRREVLLKDGFSWFCAGFDEDDGSGKADIALCADGGANQTVLYPTT